METPQEMKEQTAELAGRLAAVFDISQGLLELAQRAQQAWADDRADLEALKKDGGVRRFADCLDSLRTITRWTDRASEQFGFHIRGDDAPEDAVFALVEAAHKFKAVAEGPEFQGVRNLLEEVHRRVHGRVPDTTELVQEAPMLLDEIERNAKAARMLEGPFGESFEETVAVEPQGPLDLADGALRRDVEEEVSLGARCPHCNAPQPLQPHGNEDPLRTFARQCLEAGVPVALANGLRGLAAIAERLSALKIDESGRVAVDPL